MLGYLQLTGKTAIEKAQGIIKRATYSDLANSKSRLCIYFRPSRKTGNPLTMEDVLEIDVHVPVSYDYAAYDALQRAFLLLDERERRRTGLVPEIAYHLFRWDGQLGDLLTATNYFCAGARFSAIVTMRNP
jgi:hypothetical protein